MSHLGTLDPCAAVALDPVFIPKPWGQEIWYTGMEARGESGVVMGDETLPLSGYLAQHPNPTDGQPLLLLKILDPKPHAGVGNLYFEVHEEKQEVYVVTHVDSAAWPEGQGAIRFGMNQQRRAQSANDDAFRKEFRAAVAAYEKIRRAIDDQQVDVESARPEEAAALAHMESFTQLQSLQPGDVIKVPTWTPHALQHGVRVVEFQTQTYERYIISFTQKVLTQDHWDTDHAVAHMRLEQPVPDEFETVHPGVERVARFDDFNVWRVRFDTAQELALPRHIPYAVCMTISGAFDIGSLHLDASRACLLPRPGITQQKIQGSGVLLMAAPQL